MLKSKFFHIFLTFLLTLINGVFDLQTFSLSIVLITEIQQVTKNLFVPLKITKYPHLNLYPNYGN